MFRNMTNDQRGTTVIEYALLLALIAVASTGSIAAAGDGMASTFNSVAFMLGNSVG